MTEHDEAPTVEGRGFTSNDPIDSRAVYVAPTRIWQAQRWFPSWLRITRLLPQPQFDAVPPLSRSVCAECGRLAPRHGRLMCSLCVREYAAGQHRRHEAEWRLAPLEGQR